ncbi:MAG: enoyl-CoA hydratase-related protein, partial [candidate division NC10 bacterium]
QHFQEALYTGRTWGVDEALRRGLIDDIVEAPALLERACAVASTLAAIPSPPFRLPKEDIRRPARERWEAGRARVDAEVAEIWDAAPAREAIQRYVERTLGKGR